MSSEPDSSLFDGRQTWSPERTSLIHSGKDWKTIEQIMTDSSLRNGRAFFLSLTLQYETDNFHRV